MWTLMTQVDIYIFSNKNPETCGHQFSSQELMRNPVTGFGPSQTFLALSKLVCITVTKKNYLKMSLALFSVMYSSNIMDGLCHSLTFNQNSFINTELFNSIQSNFNSKESVL